MTPIAFNLDAQSKFNLGNYKVFLITVATQIFFYKIFYGILLSITSTFGRKIL